MRMANKYNLNDFKYGGKYHEYVWDVINNPNATIQNGLANCTTLAISFCYILKTPYPVLVIKSASVWDKYLTNGWTCENYGSCDIKVGDIIQWVEHCHVATVIGFKDGEPLLACSWYTGEHGKSTYNGSYDTRYSIHSLPQLSDFMSTNYAYRFYHETTLSDEANRTGGMPEHVLVAPTTIKSVKRDETRNQIQVLSDDGQNVRNGNMDIIGLAKKGYYNVMSTMTENGYLWYEVYSDKYIAQVDGRVVFLPSQSAIDDIANENVKLKEEISVLKEKINRIKEMCDI